MSDQVGNPEDLFSQNEAQITEYCIGVMVMRNKLASFKKETNTFGSKILKNLGLKKSGHLEIRDYLNFSQFFTLGQ